ncbi:hypothetical protein ACQP2U_07645 [Nocardia sp. CA-084685]|uniref:hypothetical protein n=1 Tax=Nocardia sp. CA-084685 TaxID=3239970 RepID=UPI003D9577C8
MKTAQRRRPLADWRRYFPLGAPNGHVAVITRTNTAVTATRCLVVPVSDNAPELGVAVSNT